MHDLLKHGSVESGGFFLGSVRPDVSPSHFISPINLPTCLPACLPASLFRRPRDGRVTYRIDYVVEGKVGQDRTGRTETASPPRRAAGAALSVLSMSPSSSFSADFESLSTLHRKPKDKKPRLLLLLLHRICVQVGGSSRCRAAPLCSRPFLHHLAFRLRSWAEAKILIVSPDASAPPCQTIDSGVEVEIYAASHAFWRSSVRPSMHPRSRSPSRPFSRE